MSFSITSKKANRDSQRGFTLVELVVAVTMLATFILPMLYMITDSRARAFRYTFARQMRGLAQEKLYDRIHYYELEDQGTFEEEGFPKWTWQIDEPQIRSQGEQVVLTYTIHVHIPQKVDKAKSDADGTNYDYSMWAFPDEKWYEEQDLLFESGQYSPLHGDPSLQQ